MNTSTATKTKPLSATNNLLELQLQQSLQQQQRTPVSSTSKDSNE